MFSNATLAITALAASIALCGAPAASAKTVVVKKNGPISTIQAGVDAASAGDKVLVKQGVYKENVVVSAPKTNLMLIAKGPVVLDARPGGVTGSGPGLRVLAASVTVKGFDIRHAKDHPSEVAEKGHGIIAANSGLKVQDCRFSGHQRQSILASGASGMQVLKCSFRGGAGAAVEVTGESVEIVGCVFRNVSGGALITGSSARVEKCVFEACRGVAVNVSGGLARVEGNRMRAIDAAAIVVSGSSALVRANVAENVDGNGIGLSGSSAKVLKNKLTDLDGKGIEISGTGAVVDKNLVRHAEDAGLTVVSHGAAIRKNRVESCATYGIDFAGDDASIVKNEVASIDGYGIHSSGSGNDLLDNDVRSITNTDPGIYVTASSGSGGTISGNRIRWGNGSGLEISSQLSNLSVTGNHVEGCGSANSDAGIYIAGSGHDVRQNTSRRNAGDGFILFASHTDVIDNLSTDNGQDGFDVGSGVNVLLRKNVARMNLGEGIEINAAGTKVEKNQATKNRIDFATSVALGSYSGNSFGDGSDTSTLPEID